MRRYNEDRARRYKVEKASEEIIMENGARRRGNKGVKQKREGGGRCTPKRKAGNKNERVRTRLTWKGGRKEGMNTVVGRIREVTAVPDERAE